jgi:hypothetical protein
MHPIFVLKNGCDKNTALKILKKFTKIRLRRGVWGAWNQRDRSWALRHDLVKFQGPQKHPKMCQKISLSSSMKNF